jgi:hypothetical protein
MDEFVNESIKGADFLDLNVDNYPLLKSETFRKK